MKEKEFFIWLDGFVSACNSHQPTPAQWDLLVDTMKKVKENLNTHSGNITFGTTTAPNWAYSNTNSAPTKAQLND